MQHVFFEANGSARQLGKHLRQSLQPESAIVVAARIFPDDANLHISSYLNRPYSVHHRLTLFRKDLDSLLRGEPFILYAPHLGNVFLRVLQCHPDRASTVYVEEGTLAYKSSQAMPRVMLVKAAVRTGLLWQKCVWRYGVSLVPEDAAEARIGMTPFAWPNDRGVRRVSIADVYAEFRRRDSAVFAMSWGISLPRQICDLKRAFAAIPDGLPRIAALHPGHNVSDVRSAFAASGVDAELRSSADPFLKSSIVIGYASSVLLYAAALGTATVSVDGVPPYWPNALRPSVTLGTIPSARWNDLLEPLFSP